MTLLRRHRKAKGLTQGELSRKLNVSVSAVSDWENGKYFPRPRILPKLAALLGISALDLTRVIVPNDDATYPPA